MSSKADFVRANRDTDTELVSKYNINAIPCMIWTDSTGNVLQQTSIYNSAGSFSQAITNFIGN